MHWSALTKLQTDPLLVRRILSGDKAVFPVLYDRHERKVFHLLRRLTTDATLAEDLAQETWVTAFESLGKWRGQGQFSSWVCGIAVRSYQSYVRHNPRTDDITSVDQAHSSLTTQQDGWAYLSRREADAALERAVAALPEECRATYVLIRVEGMRYKEAATLLDVPIGTVQSRLHRATRLLLASLAPLLEEALPALPDTVKGDSHVHSIQPNS